MGWLIGLLTILAGIATLQRFLFAKLLRLEWVLKAGWVDLIEVRRQMTALGIDDDPEAMSRMRKGLRESLRREKSLKTLSLHWIKKVKPF